MYWVSPRFPTQVKAILVVGKSISSFFSSGIPRAYLNTYILQRNRALRGISWLLRLLAMESLAGDDSGSWSLSVNPGTECFIQRQLDSFHMASFVRQEE